MVIERLLVEEAVRLSEALARHIPGGGSRTLFCLRIIALAAADAEDFVRRVLSGTFGQEVDDRTVKEVAAKVEKAVRLPSPAR